MQTSLIPGFVSSCATQRNLAIILSNQLVISVCSVAITMRWYALAKGHTGSHMALKVLGQLGISQCLTVIPAGKSRARGG
jgi:hypothetical protein